MMENTRVIKTSCGREYLVDADMFEYLNSFRWYYRPMKLANGDRGYAYRCVRRTTVYMHRMVIEAKKGEIVDHINRDPSDNRRSNLRIVTARENVLNSSNVVSLHKLVAKAAAIAADVHGASRKRSVSVEPQD